MKRKSQKITQIPASSSKSQVSSSVYKSPWIPGNQSGQSQVGQTSQKPPPTPTTTVVYKSRCTHYGNVFVLEKKDVRIWGGGISRGAAVNAGMIVINLTETESFGAKNPIKVVGFDLPEMEKWQKVRYISIPVQDMKAPLVHPDFWYDLVDALINLAKKEGGVDILVVCQGGHGRTGTVLSILAGILMPELDNPVEFIRKEYCEEAVETQSQELYVRDVLDMDFPISEYNVKTTNYNQGALNNHGYYD